MKRILSFISFVAIALSVVAQTPEAVLESIRQYPTLGGTVHSTYPSVPFTKLAETPEGFEPFYFSLVGRHGSRYEQTESRFKKACTAFNKADTIVEHLESSRISPSEHSTYTKFSVLL